MNFKKTTIIALILAITTPSFYANAEVGWTITRSIEPIATTTSISQNTFVDGFIQYVDTENKKLHMIWDNEEFFFVNIDDKSDINYKFSAWDFIEVESHPFMTLIYPPEYYAISIEKSENEFAKLKKEDWKYVIESAFGLSHNDFGQYSHLKESLDRKYQDRIEQLIYNLDRKYSRTHPKQKAYIFEKLAEKAENKIWELIMKYPADAGMSKKDTLKYNVYTFLKYKLEIKSHKLNNG